jgi:hypothetical protein
MHGETLMNEKPFQMKIPKINGPCKMRLIKENQKEKFYRLFLYD